MIGTQIEFKNLSKTFPSRKKGAENVVALSDINLTVAPGEIIGIIGYSGAGKSTLVRMINGLDTPTSGEVLLDGTNIVGMKEKELRAVRRNIGMIFQQFNLMNSRTAAGNIDYPLKLAGIPKDERDERVAELLDFVGLSDRGDNYPEQLSGGQKQRVGIARALASNPALLVDFPQEVEDFMRGFWVEGRCAIADKVAVMENGKIMEYGTTYEVFSNPKTVVAQKFVATSLRNTPDTIESEELLSHEGRLFTINLTEESGFFAAAAEARSNGASIGIVHGGVTTLQRHSFGKVTVRLTGPKSAIDDFHNRLQRTTDIKEILR